MQASGIMAVARLNKKQSERQINSGS